jgi:hypothetical protein
MYQVPVVTCRDQIGSYRSDCGTGVEVVAVTNPGTITIPVWLLAVGVLLLLMSNRRGN